MVDFLDKVDDSLGPLLTDEVVESAAYNVIGELVKRHSWLTFLRKTEIEGTLYTAPELT